MSEIIVTRNGLVLYVSLSIVVCPVVFFLRYTVSDCPFGIFKLFLQTINHIEEKVSYNERPPTTFGGIGSSAGVIMSYFYTPRITVDYFNNAGKCLLLIYKLVLQYGL